MEKDFPDAVFMLSKGSSYFTVIFVTAQLVMGALALYGQGKKVKHRRIARRYMTTLKKWHTDGVPDVQPLWKPAKNAEWNAMVKMKDTTAAFDAGIEALHECCLVVFETMAAYQRVASSPNDGKIEREKGATLLDSVDCKLSRVGKRREG